MTNVALERPNPIVINRAGLTSAAWNRAAVMSAGNDCKVFVQFSSAASLPTQSEGRIITIKR